MGAYATPQVDQYWQVRTTGQIMLIRQPENHVFSPEWHLNYRRVRLLHHPESTCVFVEDYGTCLSALDDPCVVELDLKEYKYWNLIYSNPDI
ncbi:hypothetical protein K2A41_004197 [Salmonella enterica subsp. enterica serovar Braenderup]|nr:hypothetical protein [Salmonella enterica]EHK8126815.1 hypothetical protein [Salmonella enterica subsp. enterica serovar Braenderup]EHX6256225.1 hypothetical protein [Salmonella enterica subsp. enterica serovar Braenderup]QQO88200.1 hypothetical protein LHMDDPJI_00004 [Salmonella phage vB_SenS_ER3]